METYYIIYETTNLVNGKKYRGIHKTNKLEDGYLGSGLALEIALQKYGEQNFSREILEFCSSYEELIEKEKIYVDEEWVKDKSNYNLKTGGQSSGILSQESKERRYENGEIIPTGGFSVGDIPWNKGIGMKDSQKEKLSEFQIERYKNDDNHPFKVSPNRKGWNKGLKTGPQSEESKRKKSKTLKERWKTQEHHSKGVEPWNKGKKGSQIAWNKGKTMERHECPHCGKLTDISNGKRWHFDNCKLKSNV